MKNYTKRILSLLLAVFSLAGLAACGVSEVPSPVDIPEEAPDSEAAPEVSVDFEVADVTVIELIELEDEVVALSEAPAAVSQEMTVSAPGVLVKSNSNAAVDYSNTKDGYVMVQYTTETAKKLKVIVKGPTTSYTYSLTPLQWTAFPLSDGNGKYKITVYRNVKNNSYASVLSLSVNVEMTDEFAPFLHSNQYVNYDDAPETFKKAVEITAGLDEPLEKVEAVYNFVVKGMTYDKKLAKTVKSGYLPVLDEVLERKSGICFDYAALMTGMLRSQGVPCKLVVGYAGSAYHAWISVWSEEGGWIDGVIFFDGASWQRMDPTFASSGKQSKSIMSYIGDGSNYSAKYFY